MIQKAKKYQKIIFNATRRCTRFHKLNNQYKPIVDQELNLTLPSTYLFRSSQQIQNNIIHQTPLYNIHMTLSLNNNWPYSCIGLILCEHHQNNNIVYVYGTGTLIHNNIVLTSAQNVYCRRLHTEYINIKFITGVNGYKCSGIYDVMRVHYPKEYTNQEGYQQYDFAVLYLYNDLSDSCGYVRWKTYSQIKNRENIILYGYTCYSNQRSFQLRSLKQNQKLLFQHEILCQGSGAFLKQGNQYYIVGFYISQIGRYKILNQRMRNIINQWTTQSILTLCNRNLREACNQIAKYAINDLRQLILSKNNNIREEGCKQLSRANWKYLTKINLQRNRINIQGCKQLSQSNWINLTTIELKRNYISAQGCKYLSQANWIHLTRENNICDLGCKFLSEANWIHLMSINLQQNKIGAQGCKYLSRANWTYLTKILLNLNKINAQGCKYLSQANWAHLNNFKFSFNSIYTQGCKYLSQANWTRLTTIDLSLNRFSVQACKNLSEANWPYLTKIDLSWNDITSQGCKYLSQANWIHLNTINLQICKIDAQGCKYLSQANWKYLKNINLWNNNIQGEGYKYLSQTNWPHLNSIQLKYDKNNINGIFLRELWPQIKFW